MKRFITILLILILTLSAVPSFAVSSAPELEAEGALLIDMTTGEILYEKNSHEKFYPASTTKMLTCILALENLDTAEETVVTKAELKGITGDKLNLLPDEKLGIGVMTTAMMVISANDVAVVLANRMAGSVKEFAKMMNAKAAEIGCTESNFVNPHGLHDKKHYTTCSDLAKIAMYCMQNEVFRRIVARADYTIAPTNKTPYRYLDNTNKLLNEDYYEGCIGIKTGQTTPAGGCLVAAATRGDTTLLSVVMKSSADGRFTDTRALLDWGFANYQTVVTPEEGYDLGTIKVKKGAAKSVELECTDIESVMTLPIAANKELTTKISVEEYLTAPVAAGTVCGTLAIMDGNTVVQEFDIKTKEAVEAKGGLFSKTEKTSKKEKKKKEKNNKTEYDPSAPQDNSIPGVGISLSWGELIKYVAIGGLGLFLIIFILYVIYKERQAAKRKARRAARRKEMAEREKALKEEFEWSSRENHDNEI